MREATQRLIEFGLSEKEAGVYLAMLELGPTAVQEIADKSGVNRSTTYTTIESLKRRGLISSVDDGQRVLFTAESPSRLQAMVGREQQDIQLKQERLEHAMPYFLALFNSIATKPTVRFFEGEEGIVAARETLMHTRGEYLSFTAIDEGTLRISKIGQDQRLRMSRWVRGRYLYSLKPGCEPPVCDLRSWQVREIPFDQSPFTGEINIVDQKVVAFVATVEPIAFLVENQDMSGLFRAMFDAAWQTAKPT